MIFIYFKLSGATVLNANSISIFIATYISSLAQRSSRSANFRGIILSQQQQQHKYELKAQTVFRVGCGLGFCAVVVVRSDDERQIIFIKIVKD